MYANRICKQVKKMFDLIRTFFLKSKKKPVESETISSSGKYDYRINYP